MAVTLALLEMGSLFAACSLVLLWMQPNLPIGLDMATSVAMALVMSLCFLVSFYYNGLYDLRSVRSITDLLPRLPRSLALALMLLIVIYVFFPVDALNGNSFAVSLAVIGTLVFLERAACYSLIQHHYFAQKVLVLGDGSLAMNILREIKAAPHLGYTVCGVAGENGFPGDLPFEGPKPTPFYRYLGPIARAPEIIEEQKPDLVVVALSERRGRLPTSQLLETCSNGTCCEDGVEFFERISQKLAIENVTPSQLLFSKDFRKPKRQLVIRRGFNLVFALTGIIITAPLMALVAIAIKLDSRGPVFFKQKRVGFHGRIFKLYKFRTMHERAKTEHDSVWHREVESRITRVGKWLRRPRLDEIPQFINILRGDMDLIGPRPEMASNVPVMTREIPYYSLRTLVRPGVTGWAQVKFGYAVRKEDVTEKIRYDLYYIKHMSKWLDIHILADTVKIVLFGRGK